jgi:hypothetical protein
LATTCQDSPPWLTAPVKIVRAQETEYDPLLFALSISVQPQQKITYFFIFVTRSSITNIEAVKISAGNFAEEIRALANNL